MSLYRENAQPLLDDVFYGPHILDWLCDETGCHCCIVARVNHPEPRDPFGPDEPLKHSQDRLPAGVAQVAVDASRRRR